MTVVGTIGRLILLPIAFVVAMAAAGLVLFSLGLERVTAALATERIDAINLSEIATLLEQGALLASALSVVPALLVVIIGEVARIRSALYYTVGGGIALGAAPFLISMAELGTVGSSAPIVWQVMATAGFCGGFVYWLLAGRTA